MPLSDQCVLYVPLISNSLDDLVGGNAVSAVNFAYQAAAPGPSWHSTSGGAGYLLCSGLTLTEPFTMAVMCYVNGGAGSVETFLGYSRGSADYFQVYQTTVTNKLMARSRHSGTAGDADGGGVSGGAWNNSAGVFTSATQRECYLGATLSAPETTNVAVAGAVHNLTVGALFDGGSVSSGCDTTWQFRHWAVWNNRALTDAELDSYFANPSQVLGVASDLSGNVNLDAAVAAGTLSSAASGLSGNVDLDAVVAAGSLGSTASGLSGNVSLDAVMAAGTFSMQPGAWSVPGLRNWAGSLQIGVTVPRVSFCRLTDGAQVLVLTNQVTDGSGNLGGVDALLVAGTWYMVTGWNADGSARFALPVQAT